jgi:hypothetical protein
MSIFLPIVVVTLPLFASASFSYVDVAVTSRTYFGCLQFICSSLSVPALVISVAAFFHVRLMY